MHTTLILFQGSAGGLIQFSAHLPGRRHFLLPINKASAEAAKQLQETISGLKIGDRVVTTGGVIGVIKSVRDTSFLILSADKSMLEIARSAVSLASTRKAK